MKMTVYTFLSVFLHYFFHTVIVNIPFIFNFGVDLWYTGGLTNLSFMVHGWSFVSLTFSMWWVLHVTLLETFWWTVRDDFDRWDSGSLRYGTIIWFFFISVCRSFCVLHGISIIGFSLSMVASSCLFTLYKYVTLQYFYSVEVNIRCYTSLEL